MVRPLLMSLAFCAALPAAALAQTHPATRDAPASMADEYYISADQSMFFRYRGQPSRLIVAPAARAPVFVGSLQLDTASVAILEVFSSSSSSTLPVHAGDTLAWNNTRILAVSLDALRITNAQGTRSIPLGNDLENRPGLQGMPPRPTPTYPNPSLRRLPRGAPAPMITPANPALPPGSQDLLEQRMRQRRALQDATEFPPA